jgi:biotin carboxyl carrier protein
MKYQVMVGARTFAVEVVGATVLVDGESAEAQLMAIPRTPMRRLVVDGVAHTLAVLPDEAGWEIEHGGTRWVVEVLDERTRQLQELTGDGRVSRKGGVIKAPMPGLVLEIEVEEGQVVEAGQGLIVLEAMKMENEIKAGGAGVVQAIHVEPGQAVEKGTTLIEIGEA